MYDLDVEVILASQERRLKGIESRFHRYLYSQIDWKSRMVCILGARGTGKTTMLLQRIKEAFPEPGRALYASLDNLWFANHSLLDLVDWHIANGGTHLFLDEVHYQEEWQTMLKNIYDDYPGLSIVYTGSSLLKISRKKGDLSRRQRVYTLPGLSFREYLDFEKQLSFPAVSLGDLHSKHVELSRNVASACNVQSAFDKYLLQGYYPFFKGNEDGYLELVRGIVSQVLEGDYPAYDEVQPSTVRKARKMLMILAENPPQTPNFTKLCQKLETEYKQGMKMLFALERAALLNLLEASGATLKNLSRPAKIYCENPNLMQALVSNASVGTLRECFFLNQLRVGHNIAYPPKGDFLVDDTFLYEVGGRKKSFEQIKDIENSFLAVDNTEIGHGNRIPLWCFGFLY